MRQSGEARVCVPTRLTVPSLDGAGRSRTSRRRLQVRLPRSLVHLSIETDVRTTELTYYREHLFVPPGQPR